MNHLNVTHNTTEAEIQQFCNSNPGFCRKTITAQARHERRVKRIKHKYAEQAQESTTKPQYHLSIFDRNRS